MKTNRIEVSLVQWSEAHQTLRELRRKVFVDEQGVPEGLEWDGLDEAAVHALARASTGRPAGTGRLLEDGHIGRMAVLPNDRRQGIGSEILRQLIAAADGKGLDQIFLNAQVEALPFYQRHGFVADGGEFLDAGIPHLRMHKTLSPDGSNHRSDSIAAALARLVAKGRHAIDLFLHRLDGDLLDDPGFLSAAKQLLLAHPNNRLRICLQNVDRARAACPRLFGLLTHLPSRIELRQAAEIQRERQENFMLIDRRGYLRRLSPAHHDWLEGSDRGEADRLAALFDEIWLTAEIHPELRTLSL